MTTKETTYVATSYIAEDGKEFNDYKCCIDHEVRARFAKTHDTKYLIEEFWPRRQQYICSPKVFSTKEKAEKYKTFMETSNDYYISRFKSGEIATLKVIEVVVDLEDYLQTIKDTVAAEIDVFKKQQKIKYCTHI